MLVEINCLLCRYVMQIVSTPGKKRKQPFRFDGTLTDNEKLAYLDRSVAARDLSTVHIFPVRVNMPLSYSRLLIRSTYVHLNISLSINKKYKKNCIKNIERIYNICYIVCPSRIDIGESNCNRVRVFIGRNGRMC